jgi:hypothetical protein
MELRQVVTGTLAWTGLVVVVAVPGTEALLSRLAQPATVAHVQPADGTTAATPAVIAPKPAATAGAEAVPAIKQAAITRSVATPTPIVELDSAHPAKPQTDSTPPKAIVGAAAPAAPKIVAKLTTAADGVQPITGEPTPAARAGGVPPETAAPVKESVADLPLVAAGSGEAGTDGVHVATGEAAGFGLTDGLDAPPAPPPVPMPAADRPKPPPARVVTADELDGWKSGSLADYLRQQKFADTAAAAPDSRN